MKRFLTIALAAALLLSAIPAYAQSPAPKPVIVQIGTVQAQAANVEAGPNKIYLPLIANPQCYALNPLQPGAASTQACATVDAYQGAQSLAGYVTTIANGAPLTFQTDMPSHAVSIPQQTIEIGPQSQTPVSAQRIRITAMAYITETATDVSAAGVDLSNPMPLRAMWVIKNALQAENTSNPTLFPVSILTMHYSQPIEGSSRSTPFAECGQSVGLHVYGYPYDVQFSDATATSGNIWLRMKYPTCGGLDAYPWIRLNNFWNTLKLFPKYQDIDRDAGNGPTTYHAAVQMVGANGTITTVQAVIIVGVVGGIVLIAVFPPSGVGWWLLAGAAL